MPDPMPSSAKLKLIAQQLARILQNAWDQLTLPAATIQERQRRQQARLLSSLLLALILAITLTLIIRIIAGALWKDFDTLAFVGAIAILTSIYGLSRTHHYTASAFLTVAALFALIHTTPLWANNPGFAFFYANLPILLSGILLPLSALLGVAAITIGNMLLLVLILPIETDFYLAFLSHTLITTAVIVTFIQHRDSIEHERQATLHASERNYRLLLEQASDGIFITDEQGNYLLVNSKGREMLGSSTLELMRFNIKDTLLSTDLADAPLRFDDLASGKTVIAECRLRRKNETFIPVEVSLKRLDDGRLQAIVRDISERKQMEEALRRSEERYRLVVESSFQGIAIFHGSRIAFVNPAMAQIMGYSAAELTALSPEQILATVHPDDRAAALARSHMRRQGDASPTHYQYRIIRPDGTLRWLEIFVTPMVLEGTPEVLSISLDITERKQAEQALRASEERYRSLFDNSPTPVAEQDYSVVKTYIEQLQREGINDFRTYFESHPEALAQCAEMVKIINLNKASLELYQAESKEELMQGLSQLFDQKSYEAFKELLIAITQGKTRLDQETVNRTLRGEQKNIAISWLVMPGYEETLSKTLVSIVDMTERKQLEEQLRQAQKLEAIGRLAGGVAHDFNNILTVIKGYAGLVIKELDAENPLSSDIEQIRKAAERAAALTSQLLAFSRKQILQPVVLDLNTSVTNTDKMLRRLIGEDINLTTFLEPALGRIKADAGQIEQVIINLALNARDAMPQGGKLTIETANIYLDEAYTRQHVGVKTGSYVMLAISDTGSGMDEEIRTHVFEPFFTTKEQGEGTGLGLAMVHGIVNQSGGHIWLYSELGQGATFKVYLPRVEEADPSTRPTPQIVTPARRGSETILLVEDEALVRELAQRVLLDEGYIVLEASYGQEALRVAQQHQGSIDLLVTDVVMPGGMSGRQLAERLSPLRREMKVLYMSGYTDNAIVHHGVLDADIAFLQKPFTPNYLLNKVREVLDTPQGQDNQPN